MCGDQCSILVRCKYLRGIKLAVEKKITCGSCTHDFQTLGYTVWKVILLEVLPMLLDYQLERLVFCHFTIENSVKSYCMFKA
ncbi:hypothetical protein HanXRQr2_Chr10g0449911 [Helianthus annuus]|uniref:Uncharacterized protein n=1 Tax=Helianthus annuus TaxID=4232 RepID=A0A9K3HZF9_HELAN|nr:hypothetical protein HanXRQr2_Chr10g0449911 [Helianthus annuus]